MVNIQPAKIFNLENFRLYGMLFVVINVHTILILSSLYRISDAQVVRVECEVN